MCCMPWCKRSTATCRAPTRWASCNMGTASGEWSSVIDRWTNGSLQLLDMRRIRELYLVLAVALFAVVARQLAEAPPRALAAGDRPGRLRAPAAFRGPRLHAHPSVPALGPVPVDRAARPSDVGLRPPLRCVSCPWDYETSRSLLALDVSSSALVYPAAFLGLVVLPLLIGPAPALRWRAPAPA